MNQFPAVFNMSSLNGTNGFQLTSTDSIFGFSIASAGDINNDGTHDIVIGTTGNNGGADANVAYVIFGSNNPFHAAYNIGVTLDGLGGFKLTSTSDWFGCSVASAGDLNGDGIQDIIIGAAGANAAYVIFGSKNPFPNPFDVDSLLTGSNGFKLTSTSLSFGASVASAGDLNGDEIQDIIIGAPDTNYAIYVIFGSKNAFQNPFDVDSLLKGSNGFKLTSTSNGFGSSVAGAGDFNGDKISDILIGTGGQPSPNTAYVVFGSRNAFPSSFSVDSPSLTGLNGFKLVSTNSGTNSAFGSPIAGAGDLNGDNLQDIIVGGAATNAAYVVFGNSSVFPAVVDVGSFLTGCNGFKLIGRASLNLGASVACAGDLNGDGLQDIAIGAPNVIHTTYVIFGSKSIFSPSFYVDSPSLTGSNGFTLVSTSSSFGSPIARAGDLNGDWIQDIVIGTSSAPANNIAYIVFGQNNTVPYPLLLPSSPITPVPQPASTPENYFPPLPQPYFSPSPEHSTDSGSTTMIIGIVAGVAAIGVIGGLIAYTKIKHLWCFAHHLDDYSRPGFVEPMPEIRDPLIGVQHDAALGHLI